MTASSQTLLPRPGARAAHSRHERAGQAIPVRRRVMTMRTWLDAVRAELEIDVAVDERLLLDLARDVAHTVDRPAAPLTTFLVGYAAGRDDALTVPAAAGKVAQLAADWPNRQASP